MDERVDVIVTGQTVLVTSRSFSSGSHDYETELVTAGCRVIRRPPAHDLDDLADALPATDAWIAGVGPIGQRHLERAPSLRIIARYGVGTDAVDIRSADRRGVFVTNTPGANSQGVAEHACALLFDSLRRVTASDRRVRDGRSLVNAPAREFASLRIGVIGFGQIGRRVSGALRALGAVVAVHDPYVPEAELETHGCAPSPLARLAATCDAVTIHAPGEQALIDANWLAAAKPGLRLVNTARAEAVDEYAVAAALRAGRLGAYATDVLSGDDGAGLLNPDLSDRVTVTPHIAAHTVESIDRMSAAVTAAVLQALQGGVPDNLVTESGREGRGGGAHAGSG